MKKYQWDINELIKNQNILKHLYQLESDDERKKVIKIYIDLYTDMLNIVFKRKTDITDLLEISINYDNQQDLIDNLIDSYLDNDPNIINILLQSYTHLIDVYKPTPQQNFPVILTNDQLIEINNDFVKTTFPSNLRNDFLKCINKAPIHISYNKLGNDYSGVTIYDEILRKKYIYVERVNDLMDMAILPHESFHYYFNDFSISPAETSNIIYTAEIEGSFADILFGDYFYNNVQDYNNTINMNFLNIYYECITDLVVCGSLLDSLNQNKSIRMNKLNKQLSYFQIDNIHNKEEIIDYLITPLDTNIKYALGYLVAIDLYYIYLNDPEFAFYLLKNIRFVKSENDLFSLFRKNHITFMDDNYDNLKKYVKKIERQK